VAHAGATALVVKGLQACLPPPPQDAGDTGASVGPIEHLAFGADLIRAFERAVALIGAQRPTTELSRAPDRRSL
jgi:hypothetical protein